MIEIKNISSGYNGRDVIKNLSFNIDEAEFVAVIGPNGSGKSTLIKTIEGLISLTKGEILIDREKLNNISIKERAKKIAYLSQQRSIPDISVGRMVMHGRFPYLSYPRKYSKTDYEITNEALSKFGIAEYKDKLISELSGGQRQMVYLAMAYAQKTNVFLFDEPLTFLDIKNQLEIMKTAKELTREGKTVVMIIHDLSLALRFADRLILLNDGELCFDGTADELLKSGIIEKTFGVNVTAVTVGEEIRYITD